MDPGVDPAAHVDGVREARALDHGEHLGRPPAHLAVQDDLLVAGQLLKGGSVEELPLGDEDGTIDADDLELVGPANVHQQEVDVAGLARIEHVLQLHHRDRRVAG